MVFKRSFYWFSWSSRNFNSWDTVARPTHIVCKHWWNGLLFVWPIKTFPQLPFPEKVMIGSVCWQFLGHLYYPQWESSHMQRENVWVRLACGWGCSGSWWHALKRAGFTLLLQCLSKLLSIVPSVLQNNLDRLWCCGNWLGMISINSYI